MISEQNFENFPVSRRFFKKNAKSGHFPTRATSGHHNYRFPETHYQIGALRVASIFTARRVASAVLATAIPSVCPFVRPSVTRRYCVKTTARSTMQFALSDSKMCLLL